MKVRINDSYEELSEAAAEFVINHIAYKPNSVLGLAAGGTPLLLYKLLGDACKEGRVDFSRVRTFNLDEYIGLPADHPQSYRYFMQKNLFTIDVLHVQSFSVRNTAHKCRR